MFICKTGTLSESALIWTTCLRTTFFTVFTEAEKSGVKASFFGGTIVSFVARTLSILDVTSLQVVGRQVTESDPFSWLTIGATPFTRNFQLRLNEVAGVDDPGPAFMQAVFNLGVGDVGVAVNHPQAVVYVVRVVRHASTVRELQDNFLLSSASEVNQVRQANFQYIVTSLVNELVTTHHLHWVGTLGGTDQR